MKKVINALLPTLLGIVTLTLASATACRADATAPPSGGFNLLQPVQDYFEDWFARASRTQAEQPHWMTPVVTVTPRLEQELRYDQSFQSAQHGELTTNYGSGKGIELIPWDTIEAILGIPNYESHEYPGKKGAENRGTDDFGDWTALVKYRLLSANEENGNYILTAFMGFSAPTGTSGNSTGHAQFTPTIAFGKGFGDFDFQSTVGVTFPDGGLDRLGMPLAYNTAFQYHLLDVLWPEVEVNYTWFPDGEHAGKNQVYLTPGLILGRFPIWERVKLIAGAGFQVAVTKYAQYHNSWIITGRVTF
jgi:hypothetical protein